MKIIVVTPETVLEQTIFCSRNPKTPEFRAKKEWFDEQFRNGLKLCILRDEDDKALAYIEYIPAEFAWRPVSADGYLFIHCMYNYAKKDREAGIASILIQHAIEDAKTQGKNGVVVFSSKGTWMADKRVFEKNGFQEISKLDRFELMVFRTNDSATDPSFIDWTDKAKEYDGWHLLYNDQCPWHYKSAGDLQKVAQENGILLNVTRMTSHIDAQNAPSGFAGFNLIYNGKLLEDHYISGTRFKNILKKII